MKASPTPAEVLSARQAAAMTRTEAAALVHVSERNWTQWETGKASMHPAIFELFCDKTHKGRFDRIELEASADTGQVYVSYYRGAELLVKAPCKLSGPALRNMQSLHLTLITRGRIETASNRTTP